MGVWIMYKITYTVLCYCYGNISGRCGEFDSIEDAIEKEIELRLSSDRGESFGIQVNWEKI